MKTKVIPKETNYQKWLNDYKIHCSSEDVIVGNTYKGYAKIDDSIMHSQCKTIYYDEEQRILLAEEIDNNTYLFFYGRMYVYEDVIYFESCSSFRNQKPLCDFVNCAVEKAQSINTPMDKATLADILKSLVNPKIAAYFKNAFGMIADAYLGGWID